MEALTEDTHVVGVKKKLQRTEEYSLWQLIGRGRGRKRSMTVICTDFIELHGAGHDNVGLMEGDCTSNPCQRGTSNRCGTFGCFQIIHPS